MIVDGVIVEGDACRDFARSSKLEWLETNGTGAFAMGTVAGVNTRRYHGLLVASLHPPVERYVLLSRVEEEALIDGGRFALGVCQYPGVVTPRGFERLHQFRTGECSTWNIALNTATLEKQVYLVPGHQAVMIRYRSDRPGKLRVRTFLAYRDYHSLGHARSDVFGALPKLEFQYIGQFESDAHWYYNVEYLAELDRGMDFREDLFSPGVIVLDLKPREWISICASLGPSPQPAPHDKSGDLPPFVVSRADGRPTILAGYPWFTDWGRDAMISLPGLLIGSGHLREARAILEAFLSHLNHGLIPNRFLDKQGAAQYNTADATLWMFQAVRAWLIAAGGDRKFLCDTFYPAAKEIIGWHQRGTLYGIGVDPSDRLLKAGAPDVQLTWMDTIATPRRGKPVEINALWHGALCLAAEWAAELGDPAAEEFRVESERVRESFRAKFWNPERACLYDLLAEDGPNKKFRPNQIFAVSLPYGLLPRDQQQSIVRGVERELLTPVGLRTLERSDPDYHPRYEGSPQARNAAYHHGTVWPWLLGPFIDAYLAAFGRTEETRVYCRGLVQHLETDAAQAGCLGSICEIYDGDEPRVPRGCPAQAWSVAEIARMKYLLGGV